MNIPFAGKGLRVLDFDCECRPLSYLGQDFTTGQITAIAACWIVGGRARNMQAWLLGEHDYDEMLLGFRELFDEADMVTGHYIRGFDLPLINGGLLDIGEAPLSNKLSHDTKNDLAKRKYMSVSQENLGAVLGIRAPKVKMNQAKWREANQLTADGVELTRKRVVGDVRQHVQMRQELLRRGWLSEPKVWKSAGAVTGAYMP